MRRLVEVCLFITAGSLHAQSGHWTGSIQIPNQEIAIVIDVAKSAGGELTGTITIPAQNVSGLPLRKVSVEGKRTKFEIRSDQAFAGEISADGQEILGGYTVESYSIPFSLKRSGEAQIAPPARIGAVRKELEGSWEGTLNAAGQEFRVALTLRNAADGSASGTLVDFTEGGLEMPVSALTESERNVTMEFKSMSATYTAALNEQANELAGTYRRGELTGQLRLQRKGTGR